MEGRDAGRVRRERWRLLHRVERWLERPMVVLGLVWVALLVVELTRGDSVVLNRVAIAIWVVFVADFVLRFTIAPQKGEYLRRNWLTVISLILPALRVFRVVRLLRALRLARAVRGLRLVKVLGSLNRGMKSLGRTMGRRGLGYVAALTVLVTLAGAAGMYAFEREGEGGGLAGYGDAVWWTAMVMTTLGSEYWPRTAEGRVLAVVLALYAFTVFGYITASLASFFVGRDAERQDGPVAGNAAIQALHAEIAALRAELRARDGEGATVRTSPSPPIDPPPPA